VGSAGSRARGRREPGQVRKEAAISVRLLVPGVPGGSHLRGPCCSLRRTSADPCSASSTRLRASSHSPASTSTQRVVITSPGPASADSGRPADEGSRRRSRHGDRNEQGSRIQVVLAGLIDHGRMGRQDQNLESLQLSWPWPSAFLHAQTCWNYRGLRGSSAIVAAPRSRSAVVFSGTNRLERSRRSSDVTS